MNCNVAKVLSRELNFINKFQMKMLLKASQKIYDFSVQCCLISCMLLLKKKAQYLVLLDVYINLTLQIQDVT